MKETKQHILKTSLNLFLQKNYKEVTMKEIVEKSGVSKGAFYHYYDSKERIFIEIINYAFSSLIFIDMNQFSHSSLYDFYHDYVSYMEKIYLYFQSTVIDTNEGTSSFDLNYYSLIFDAIRLFPDFRDKMVKSTHQEKEAWLNVICVAREKGEIECSMQDDQIADVFIKSNSGIGMNNIVLGKNEDTMKSVLILWDSFYNEIKT